MLATWVVIASSRESSSNVPVSFIGKQSGSSSYISVSPWAVTLTYHWRTYKQRAITNTAIPEFSGWNKKSSFYVHVLQYYSEGLDTVDCVSVQTCHVSCNHSETQTIALPNACHLHESSVLVSKHFFHVIIDWEKTSPNLNCQCSGCQSHSISLHPGWQVDLRVLMFGCNYIQR